MKILEAINRVLRWAENRHGPQPLQHSMPELKSWVTSPLACNILSEEKAQLDDSLGELFGYHLLELSCFDTELLSTSSRINNRFRLAPVEGFSAGALAEFEQLPLPEESIDVVLLHHVLEFSPNPHQLLREANRVLIPRGHLLIVGFNPWSLQGVYKVLAQWLSAAPFWRRHSLRAGRIHDWLRLLDCEPVSIQRGFYRIPVNHAGLLRRFGFWERLCRKLHLPFGGYYVLLARKDRIAMRPIKPLWSQLNPMAGLVIGKPASRMPDTARETPVTRTQAQSNSR
ncbi:class I SAM-dependent methyltransferase [Pseudomaricurvus alkylphenolicus]|jgi:SAM-dependent methyltransferase|uniref:class I SAM-dependent methyltransferase n=1 Tax=Pseudomaricurvus alkylphenolicus TaxID=1306991 RepID=UPI00142281AB|nr:class I SAM-dependent methyltransferase [Pseudomaricurvus alkylphenolicus]NIB43876.1 class I SAM-dependent methyltransferase [Pseudomaricurvus alkylphenolicus]